MNTNILKNRTTRITTLVLTLASLIFLGIFTQSCSNEELFDSRSFDIENGTSNISEIGIGDFKNWFNSQQIESELVEKNKLNWDNAEIKLLRDGQSLEISFEIYKGKNLLGNDSIRELHLAYVGNSFMGGIMAYSFYSRERAFVDFYNLSDQLFLEGMYYEPNQVYSILKAYSVERTNVRLKSGSEDDPCPSDDEPNSATPMVNEDNTINPQAYNCHYWVWGAGTSVESNPCYEPGYPKWNNCPNISGSGWSEVSTPQVGDRWVSYANLIGVGVVAYHSAIVEEVIDGKITKLKAKMGQGPISTYDPDCPKFAGYNTNAIKYYRE